MDKDQAMKLMAESHRETVKELEKEIEALSKYAEKYKRIEKLYKEIEPGEDINQGLGEIINE